jgi:hypothetical protein
MKQTTIFTIWAFVAFVIVPAISQAQTQQIQVTVENLAPTDSITFAPLRVGFNNGTFDSFNEGETATAPIISVAEGGSGSDWFPAFAAADSTATLGTVANGGPLLPGGTASAVFDVDPSVNRFFTFASMVVPSNDFFIGNDDPMEYELFDANGNLLINSITQTSDEIWDAGSEAFDPNNAAFLVNGDNSLRTPQNGTVQFNFSELAGFDGLETAAGYTFTSGLTAGQDIYRISFTAAVPEPSSAALAGFGLVGFVMRRRRKR